jgi:hypothetical protein
MQRQRRRQHDEEHDEVREKRTDADVDPAIDQIAARGAGPVDQQAPALGSLFLHLLPCLPEKKVRADRRAENRHQCSPSVGCARDIRHRGSVQHGGPLRLHQKRGNDVRKQRERQPLQRAGDLVIVQPHGQHADAQAEYPDVDARGSAAEHLCGVGHSREIRGDVDRVRYQQRE